MPTYLLTVPVVAGVVIQRTITKLLSTGGGTGGTFPRQGTHRDSKRQKKRQAS